MLPPSFSSCAGWHEAGIVATVAAAFSRPEHLPSHAAGVDRLSQTRMADEYSLEKR